MSKSLLKWLVGAVAVVVMIIVACSQQPTEPVTSANSEASDQVADHEALAKQYEKVIAAMDPYVTEQPNGEYVFDEAGFAATNASLPADEQQLVSELKDGIAIVNQKLPELKSEAYAKVWFRWYWWGYKECYSELSAEYMLDAMQFSIYGLAIYPAAKWLHYTFGYFCIYHTWAGGVWANL